MSLAPRTWVLTLLVIVCTTTIGAAQTAAPARIDLTPEEMDVFLRNAKIVRTRNTGSGVTNSRRATLSDGRVTHDAQIQVVDVHRSVFQAGRATELDFRDSYRYNIAGYRLARLLGLDNVPMSVERRVNGRPAAVTWWIDDVRMDEKERVSKLLAGPNPERTAQQVQIMRIWDELIQNRDRNQGNMLWTDDWTLWMIDHTRAFRVARELLNPDELTRCDRALLEELRGLTAEAVAKTVQRFLTRVEIAAMLARRDLIVKHFEQRISERGEANVLFTLARKADSPERSN